MLTTDNKGKPLQDGKLYSVRLVNENFEPLLGRWSAAGKCFVEPNDATIRTDIGEQTFGTEVATLVRE